MAKLDINDHLAVTGNFGLYQWVSLLLNGLLVWFFAMQMFVVVFTHESPAHRCKEFAQLETSSELTANQTFDKACNVEQLVGGVNISVDCAQFAYDSSQFTSTIVTEFDLVCKDEYYVTAVTMAWMGSEGVGALLGSFAADRFGRRPVVITTYFVVGICGSIAAFSVNLIMYVVMRCIMAFTLFAGFSAAVTLLMESTAPNKRSHAINALDLFWVAGSSLLSLWAYFLPNWQHLQLAISIAALPTGVACIWLLGESPHWLVLQGRGQEAIDILNKMARWNKVVAPNLEMEKNGLLKEEKMEKRSPSATEHCCTIWGYRLVLVRFSIFSFGWISCAFCYYSLSLGVASLPGNIFINHFIMCAVEGLAYAACFCVAWWGRKWPTVASYLLGAISLLISSVLLVYKPGFSTTALSFLGKFGISAAWQIMLIWEAEIYPTTQRCMLSALNGVVGRIGTVMAPYMVDLHKFIDVPNEDVILPAVSVALMVIAALLHAIPPETNNRKLPETYIQANVKSFPLAQDGSDFPENAEDKDLLEDGSDTPI